MHAPWQSRPITFEAFMDFCLYDPRCGYYRGGRKVFGTEGDFFTSPYTHPLFARLLAGAFAAYHRRLGSPDPFVIVELGAGEGILGKDIREALQEDHPDVSQCLEYHEVEVGRGTWPDRFGGVVFSNEFFDALPVHRVRLKGGRLRELYVEAEGEKIREVEGDLSDARIRDYLKLGFSELRDGYEYEINLHMLEWLHEIDRRLRIGFVLTIDYGYDRAAYEAVERPKGTLLCYRGHQVSEDPYTHIGEQDLTAHVNFEVVQKEGARLGWESEELIGQRDFLFRWGLEEYLKEEESRGLFDNDRLQDRLRLKDLLIPGGVSDTMKVLEQRVRVE